MFKLLVTFLRSLLAERVNKNEARLFMISAPGPVARCVFRGDRRPSRWEAFGQAVALTQRYAPLVVNTLAQVMMDDGANLYEYVRSTPSQSLIPVDSVARAGRAIQIAFSSRRAVGGGDRKSHRRVALLGALAAVAGYESAGHQRRRYRSHSGDSNSRPQARERSALRRMAARLGRSLGAPAPVDPGIDA